MKLVHQRDAHLPRTEHFLLPIYVELGAALKHQEDLVAEIVAGRLGDKPDPHPHEPRTKLGCDQHVPNAIPVVIDFESHDVPCTRNCVGT